MTSKHGVSRRRFMAAAAGTSGLALFTPHHLCAQGGKRVFKVGLIGCGGRGNGALNQHIKAAQILNEALKLNIEIRVVATADWFKDRAMRPGKRYGVPRDRCFAGAEAYKDAVDCDLDIILTAAPPAFRPPHFEAAIKAGKHVFMEKPVAVDPPGCRRIIAAGEMAKQKGLMVIAGTQRRHQRGYINTQAAVAEGAIGKILGGRVSWCMGHIFAKRPINPQSTDQVVGGWQNWVHLSGDHICEQHVHNLDIMNWFLGRPPISAAGFGGRARRQVGTQYDFFSIDFEFPGGVHVHSMCRQVAGCWNWVGEQLIAQKGTTGCGGGLNPTSPVIPAEIPQVGGGHQQEHINMLYHLVKGKVINEARNVAEATATAVLGRESSYTGQRLTWSDMMEKKDSDLYNLTLKPTAADYEKGDVPLPKENVIPRAGKPV